MIYRGLGFLAVERFGSSPMHPLSLSESFFVSPVDLSDWRGRRKEGGWGWGEAISYDGEKAWSFKSYSTLSFRALM
jgi:hypothetical protein